jgi:hypothetical protein
MNVFLVIIVLFLVGIAALVWGPVSNMVSISRPLLLLLFFCGIVLVTLIYSVIFVALGGNEEDGEQRGDAGPPVSYQSQRLT